VNGHPFAAYPGVPYAQQLDLVAALGGKSYRVDISSIDTVPALADLVALARNRGMQILPVLTPAIDLDKDTPQIIYAKTFNFAVTLASRFKGDVRVWELGNELENYAILKPCEVQDDGAVYPCTYGPAGGVTALEYVGARWQKVSAYLKGLSDGIVSVDPLLKKAIGTAGWGHFGAFNRMQADGIAWDISVWHSYRVEEDSSFERLAAFKKPIWVTEFNHPNGSFNDGVTGQADGLRTMILSLRSQLARYKIEAVFFYELLDQPYWTDVEGHFGLVAQTKSGTGWVVGEKKPAFEMVRQTIKSARTPPSGGCDMKKFLNVEVTAATKVAYSYCLVFLHEPDGQGLNDYAREIARGMSADALVVGLTQADWFSELHNPESRSDNDYVDWAYQMLLGRRADGAGMEAFARSLRDGSTNRRKLLAGLIASDEFKARHALLFAPLRSLPEKTSIRN
jgi:hypothetical protein